MAFSLPSFLRLTDPELLKSYLAAKGFEAPSDLLWEGNRKELVTKLTDLIEALDVRDRNQVYRHFEQVEQLVGEVGQRALRAAFQRKQGVSYQFTQLESDRARGLLALLEDEDAFEEALAFCAADLLRAGRSYRGYTLRPPAPDPTSDPGVSR